MGAHVLDFQHIDQTCLSMVGGKGANLGEMTRAGFPVPPGFCVTTEAYRAWIEQSDRMEGYFRQLDDIEANDLNHIAELGQTIRHHLANLPMPGFVRTAILSQWRRAGEDRSYAVRSSATAEDLPTASFAGQQDTYLNICGEERLLQAIRECWASLFTDRAISYRAKHRFDHRAVHLAVVVQQMVFPEVSGILFTADPISGHRHTVAIDASFGLGEALVSGQVSADLYHVRRGRIIKKKIAKKQIGIFSVPEGGTVTQDLPSDMQEAPSLNDEQVIELAALGEKIQAHYDGTEQDIEWCCRGTILHRPKPTDHFVISAAERFGEAGRTRAPAVFVRSSADDDRCDETDGAVGLADNVSVRKGLASLQKPVDACRRRSAVYRYYSGVKSETGS